MFRDPLRPNMSIPGSDGRGPRGVGYPAVVVAVLVVAAGLVVAASPGVGSMVADGSPPAEEVVENVREAYESADSWAGTAVVTVDNRSAERTTRASVQFRAPANYRYEVLGPESRAGFVAGTNGTVAWAYDGSTGMARVEQLNESQQEHLHPDYALAAERLRGNATVEVLRTVEYGGERTHVLRVTPEEERAGATTTVWVDADDWRLRKLRTAEGDRTVVAEFESFHFDVSIHDSSFVPPEEATFTSAADVERTTYESLSAARAEADPALPAATLGDAEFDGATLLRQDGTTTVALTYADDAGGVLVVASDAESPPFGQADGETIAVGDRSGTYATVRDRNVVAWEQGGTTYAVVGDRSKAELVALAEAVAGSLADE